MGDRHPISPTLQLTPCPFLQRPRPRSSAAMIGRLLVSRRGATSLAALTPSLLTCFPTGEPTLSSRPLHIAAAPNARGPLADGPSHSTASAVANCSKCGSPGGTPALFSSVLATQVKLQFIFFPVKGAKYHALWGGRPPDVRPWGACSDMARMCVGVGMGGWGGSYLQPSFLMLTGITRAGRIVPSPPPSWGGVPGHRRRPSNP